MMVKATLDAKQQHDNMILLRFLCDISGRLIRQPFVTTLTYQPPQGQIVCNNPNLFMMSTSFHSSNFPCHQGYACS